jgi:hypothetical protein
LLWLEDTSNGTSLAVQQQRFETDSNADQVKTKVLRHRCIYLRIIDND